MSKQLFEMMFNSKVKSGKTKHLEHLKTKPIKYLLK